MNKDRMKGKTTEIGGKMKEGVGKATGSDRLKAEGKTDQVKGKVQNVMGKAQDAGKETARKAEEIGQGVSDSLRHSENAEHREHEQETQRKKDAA